MFNRLTELREKRANGDKGFTLIELLVVVVIIGILIAIAIPLYLNYRKGASDKSAQSDLRGAISALEQCNSDNNGTYPAAPTGNALSGTITGCSQTFNVSDGTSLKYYVSDDKSKYLMTATNSNGNATGGSNGYYCYASAAGGSVKKYNSATTPAAVADACS